MPKYRPVSFPSLSNPKSNRQFLRSRFPFLTLIPILCLNSMTANHPSRNRGFYWVSDIQPRLTSNRPLFSPSLMILNQTSLKYSSMIFLSFTLSKRFLFDVCLIWLFGKTRYYSTQMFIIYCMFQILHSFQVKSDHFLNITCKQFQIIC